MARRPGGSAGRQYIPSIGDGLRAQALRTAPWRPNGNPEVLADLAAGNVLVLSSAAVDQALLTAGDDQAWKVWRNDRMNREHPWQPADPEACWDYDPATGSLSASEAHVSDFPDPMTEYHAEMRRKAAEGRLNDRSARSRLEPDDDLDDLPPFDPETGELLDDATD